MAYSNLCGTTKIVADSITYRIQITGNGTGRFNIAIYGYKTANFSSGDSLSALTQILAYERVHGTVYRTEAATSRNNLNIPSSLNTWTLMSSFDIICGTGASRFHLTPNDCKIEISNYNSSKGVVETNSISFVSDWTGPGFMRLTIYHKSTYGLTLHAKTDAEYYGDQTITLSTLKSSQINTRVYSYSYGYVNDIRATTVTGSGDFVITLEYTGVGNWQYDENKITDWGVLSNYSCSTMKYEIYADEPAYHFLKLYKFTTNNYNMNFAFAPYLGTEYLTAFLITSLSDIDVYSGTAYTYIASTVDSEHTTFVNSLEAYNLSPNTTYYIMVKPNNIGIVGNGYNISYMWATNSSSKFTSLVENVYYSAGEYLYLKEYKDFLVKNETAIFKIYLTQNITDFSARFLYSTSTFNTNCYLNTSLVGIDSNGVPTSYVWSQSGGGTETFSAYNYVYLYLKWDAGYYYNNQIALSLGSTSTTAYMRATNNYARNYTLSIYDVIDGTVQSANNTYSRVVASIYGRSNDSNENLSKAQTIAFGNGQEVEFLACIHSNSYNKAYSFKGFWSNPNGTGTYYGNSPTRRFIFNNPASTTNIYAVWKTLPNTFNWTYNKISGGEFKISASEWNELTSRCLYIMNNRTSSNYWYYYTNEYSDFMFYVQIDDLVTATAYNNLATLLINEYSRRSITPPSELSTVNKGDLISAAKINVLRDAYNAL